MTTRRMRCEEEVGATGATEGGSREEGEGRPSSRPPTPRTGDFLGKHRLSAAINRLNQEIHSLQVRSLSSPLYPDRPTSVFYFRPFPRLESWLGRKDHVLLA
ncbi:hypothetical protein COCNU_scaffold003706G000010 [Cocos nucifera]|nr:hypothetical protein [Cocos nucifera]